MRALAVELICFIQHGRWYNGKVDSKLADAVAERLMWGPGTGWWPSDQALCRQWLAERRKRDAVPTLPRPLAPPSLPRPLAPPPLPRPLVPPTLPRGLPPLDLPRKS